MIDLNQRLEQTIKQTLELSLSPKIIQMLKILNLPYTELLEKIEKEVEENVTLDIERHDRLAEYLTHISKERISKKELTKEDLPGIETLEALPETLQEHLIKQLELEEVSPKYNEIARHLISSLDERGFFNNYPEIRDNIMKAHDVSRPTVDKILKIIQGFEPDGVGARNLKECLLIQIEEYNFDNEELKNILFSAVKDHLEDLGAKNFLKIAKTLGITEEGAKNLAEFIKNNLNPNPGSIFATKTTSVVPSFALEQKDDKYIIVNLEKKYGPILKINQKYMAMLKDPKTDKETLEFLKKKMGTAKELLENIARRHETIEKVLDIITKKQQVFFEKGSLHLQPLPQKEVAGEIGVHPSTISRALAEKYIQTPKELYRLKFLCPREYKGHTVERIKKLISGIVNNEQKEHPLSDEEIKDLLHNEGVTIERRTVAEYRKELNIPSSSSRKVKS